jgi:hypothetical protein
MRNYTLMRKNERPNLPGKAAIDLKKCELSQ